MCSLTADLGIDIILPNCSCIGIKTNEKNVPDKIIFKWVYEEPKEIQFFGVLNFRFNKFQSSLVYIKFSLNNIGGCLVLRSFLRKFQPNPIINDFYRFIKKIKKFLFKPCFVFPSMTSVSHSTPPKTSYLAPLAHISATRL